MNQLKLLKGETWRFNILDENHNGVLDENKKMMHFPITQDMVDGWYMLAKRIGEGLAQSPQAAHKVEQIRGKLKMEKQAAFQAQEQAAITSAETILMDAKEATRQSAAETIKIQTLWEHSNENF